MIAYDIRFGREVKPQRVARAVRCDNKGRSDVLIVHRVGVTDANVNRPFITLAPLVCGLSQSQSIGTLDYHGLLLKFQRRFANNFSIMNSYTTGPVGAQPSE